MHNNYYFLKDLTRALEKEILGYRLTSSFTQNKNELIFIFTDNDSEFIVKAHLNPTFCCLSFPDEFHRARKNSVDIFEEAFGLKVTGIKQFLNERVFSIQLESDVEIVFKMHGNRSNVLLARSSKVVAIFNNKLEKDFSISTSHLDRLIDQTFEMFEKSGDDEKTLFPTFGKVVQAFLTKERYKSRDNEGKWSLIQEVLRSLSNGRYYVNSEALSLMPLSDSQEFNNPIVAINYFFNAYISSKHLNEEKRRVVNKLLTKVKKGAAYLDKTSKKLSEIKSNINHRIFGDLIMANLHNIPANSKKIALSNFYNEGNQISITLKPSLTAQKNAELYYKKAKNQSIEIETLEFNIERKKTELSALKVHLETIKGFEDYKELKKYLTTNKLIDEVNNELKYKPYHQFQIDDFVIWLGKNAVANDKMLHLTYKEDLWLHAKDVSGSHVIIKHQSGKQPSSHIKEKAAELAAYFSKRKNDTLCPVIITPKKFVRKRKGDPPGAVIVEKEDVILVTPENWT